MHPQTPQLVGKVQPQMDVKAISCQYR